VFIGLLCAFKKLLGVFTGLFRACTGLFWVIVGPFFVQTVVHLTVDFDFRSDDIRSYDFDIRSLKTFAVT